LDSKSRVVTRENLHSKGKIDSFLNLEQESNKDFDYKHLNNQNQNLNQNISKDNLSLSNLHSGTINKRVVDKATRKNNVYSFKPKIKDSPEEKD